ncbi:hypothetical protein QJS10_CPB04g01274 [Acorus calamus]|uniref:J domain-containing protein n=1 Tax=Acorus calamus TaxID=4465 RepID=A0AAV9EZU6_ACOCL|nr:hypothetical protein QJS10_CPB04g01274 [Acorus calamus]
MSVGFISSGVGGVDATRTPLFGRPTKQSPQHVDRLSFRTRAAVDEGFVAEKEKSFYDLLGISEKGTLSDIKQAYREMARRFHPDVSPPERADEYTKRFILVQEAYETLSDPGRRSDYDRRLAKGLHFAFSPRRFDQGLDRSEWKSCWQNQVEGLRRRSMDKAAGENMSWAARMRRKREGFSEE